jgi:hypothetical protein
MRQRPDPMFVQYYVHCKEPLPMDVDFMLSDSFEVRAIYACQYHRLKFSGGGKAKNSNCEKFGAGCICS